MFKNIVCNPDNIRPGRVSATTATSPLRTSRVTATDPTAPRPRGVSRLCNPSAQRLDGLTLGHQCAGRWGPHLKSSRQSANNAASMSSTGIVDVDYDVRRTHLRADHAGHLVQSELLRKRITKFRHNHPPRRSRTSTATTRGAGLPRTVPVLLPTAAAISSADRPTTTRRMRISRCLAGKISSSSFISVTESAWMNSCSGPASADQRSGTAPAR